MASCVENICTKNYQNLIIGFQVTIKNVGDVFLRHSVYVANQSTRKANMKKYVICKKTNKYFKVTFKI